MNNPVPVAAASGGFVGALVGLTVAILGMYNVNVSAQVSIYMMVVFTPVCHGISYFVMNRFGKPKV